MKRTLVALALMALAHSASAMLLCTNEYNESVTWYVGQDKPSLNVSDEASPVCAADGLELAYIRSRFTGLPMVSKGNGPFIWRGLNAAFILDNL